MKTHGNAELTIAQRRLIQDLYQSGHSGKSELARRFGVNRKTIDRWANRESPLDLPSGPKNPHKVITAAYRQAVIEHRKENPDHGPITIAFHLKAEYSFANRGTIQRILKQERLAQKAQGVEKKRRH